MFRNSLLLLALFCLASCEKNEDMPDPPPAFNPALTLNKCTGLNMTDDIGAAIGSVGNANVRTGQVAPYPNPCQSVLAVFSQETVSEVYFVKAEIDTSFADTDFADLFQTNPFNLDSIELQKSQSLDMLGTAMTFNLNVESFEAGYYRIFFRMENDSLYCDNVYIDPNTSVIDSRMKLFDDWN